MVEVEALANPEEENGWPVLATTVSAAVCTDTALRQASQEQHTPGAPGLRWSKNPAAISPVWRAQPERMAALARLTVVGFLVYSVLQRQVRLARRRHAPQLPGHKGRPATPTAAVGLAVFSPGTLVQ